MIKARLRALASLVLIAAAGSCSDATLPNNVGVLSFRYSGELSGTFAARGDYRADASHAGGMYVPGDEIEIRAVFRSGGVHQVVTLSAPRGRVGRYEFGPRSLGLATFIFQPQADEPATKHQLMFGTLEITTATSRRIAGRFEGLAWEALGPGIKMTGSFDVPVTSGAPGGD